MATNKPVKVDPAALTPWERSFFAFPLFHRLNREFDEVFNRLGLEKPFFENMPAMWTPELETLATDNTFLVKVDVPGLKKEEITLEITDEQLTLKGERKQEKEEKKEGAYRTERTYGSFYRVVPLPEGVKPELAKATMHDGVLEITMPLTKIEEKSKKLEITEPVPVTTTKAA
jgi:HSP20 family protein